MRQCARGDLQRLSRRDLALLLLADLGRLALWCLVVGLIGVGGCCCAGRVTSQDWMRAHPAPASRMVAELRLRRHLTRGLAELSAYLEADTLPGTPLVHRPDRVGRRQARHRFHHDGPRRPRHAR